MDAIRILIADDNRELADSLAMWLELEGYVAEAVYDGEAALARYDSFEPDLVMLDLDLPGKDGLEVAQALRARAGDEVILVAHSAYDLEMRRAANGTGTFDSFVPKDSDIHAIDGVLQAVVEWREKRGERVPNPAIATAGSP